MTPQEIAALALGCVATIGIFWLCIYFFRRILRGEGDDLIAGYNTLSDEKKAQYDIVRLRKLVSWFGMVTLVYTAVLIVVLFFWHSPASLSLLIPFVPLIAIYIWLANTWVKKK